MKIGVSIAMFDSGGYWLVGRWAGVIKDHKTRQKSQFPLELLLGAMENEEKWYAKLAWEILAKRTSSWTKPYCTWLCVVTG